MDGAGKVDGTVVVALPMEHDSPFEGGGLTFWDGRRTKDPQTGKSNPPAETHYDTRSGDVAFIDRCVQSVCLLVGLLVCFVIPLFPRVFLSFSLTLAVAVQSGLAPGRSHYQGNTMGIGHFLQGHLIVVETTHPETQLRCHYRKVQGAAQEYCIILVYK